MSDLFEQWVDPDVEAEYASVYDGLITNNSWTQMVLDDDGVAEAMLREDSSLRAGPGGFRTPHSSFSLSILF